MTRAKKLSKLANAIRDYRGAYNAETLVWRVRPIPSAKVRVEKWLAELRMDVAATMPIIDGFKNMDEFRAWLLKIGQPAPTPAPRYD